MLVVSKELPRSHIAAVEAVNHNDCCTHSILRDKGRQRAVSTMKIVTLDACEVSALVEVHQSPLAKLLLPDKVCLVKAEQYGQAWTCV